MINRERIKTYFEKKIPRARRKLKEMKDTAGDVRLTVLWVIVNFIGEPLLGYDRLSFWYYARETSERKIKRGEPLSDFRKALLRDIEKSSFPTGDKRWADRFWDD